MEKGIKASFWALPRPPSHPHCPPPGWRERQGTQEPWLTRAGTRPANCRRRLCQQESLGCDCEWLEAERTTPRAENSRGPCQREPTVLWGFPPGAAQPGSHSENQRKTPSGIWRRRGKWDNFKTLHLSPPLNKRLREPGLLGYSPSGSPGRRGKPNSRQLSPPTWEKGNSQLQFTLAILSSRGREIKKVRNTCEAHSPETQAH